VEAWRLELGAALERYYALGGAVFGQNTFEPAQRAASLEATRQAKRLETAWREANAIMKTHKVSRSWGPNSKEFEDAQTIRKHIALRDGLLQISELARQYRYLAAVKGLHTQYGNRHSEGLALDSVLIKAKAKIGTALAGLQEVDESPGTLRGALPFLISGLTIDRLLEACPWEERAVGAVGSAWASDAAEIIEKAARVTEEGLLLGDEAKASLLRFRFYLKEARSLAADLRLAGGAVANVPSGDARALFACLARFAAPLSRIGVVDFSGQSLEGVRDLVSGVCARLDRMANQYAVLVDRSLFLWRDLLAPAAAAAAAAAPMEMDVQQGVQQGGLQVPGAEVPGGERGGQVSDGYSSASLTPRNSVDLDDVLAELADIGIGADLLLS
jgi:hypothetical protein